MNKIAFLFLIHILAWVVVFFCALVIVNGSIEFADTPSLNATSLILSFWLIVNFYVFYYKLVPDYLEKKKYKKFAIYTILIVLLIIPIDLLLWWGIFYYSIYKEGDFPSLAFPFVNIIYLYLGIIAGSLFSGGLGTFYRFGISWFKNQQLKNGLKN